MEESGSLLPGLVRKCGPLIYLTLLIQSSLVQRLVIVLLYLHTSLILVFVVGEHDLELAVQLARLGLSGLFTVEVLLRFTVLTFLHWEDTGSGPFKERLVKWASRLSRLNVVDFTLVVGGTAANFAWLYLDSNYRPDPESKMTLFIAKGLCVVFSTILFILRLLANSEEAKKYYRLMRMILPVMFDLTFLFFISIFLFAALGETIFTESSRKAAG